MISGQRKTLARLGIAFDKVIFESDFLPEVAELTNLGLSEGKLTRRHGDDMVMYETEREELEEMPLVRADGLPTQHMRALAYWSAAPELDDVDLAAGLRHRVGRPRHLPAQADRRARRRQRQRQRQRQGRRPADPRRLPRHGRPRAAGDHLEQGRGAADRRPRRVARGARSRPTPSAAAVCRAPSRTPSGSPSQVALGYFLLQPTAKRVDFEPEKLLRRGQGQPRLGPGPRPGPPRRRGAAGRQSAPAEDPDYRFAVVQSELYRRHLRSAVEGLDVGPAGPLRLPLRPLVPRGRALAARSSGSSQTVLDQGVRGLGLEAA